MVGSSKRHDIDPHVDRDDTLRRLSSHLVEDLGRHPGERRRCDPRAIWRDGRPYWL